MRSSRCSNASRWTRRTPRQEAPHLLLHHQSRYRCRFLPLINPSTRFKRRRHFRNRSSPHRRRRFRLPMSRYHRPRQSRLSLPLKWRLRHLLMSRCPLRRRPCRLDSRTDTRPRSPPRAQPRLRGPRQQSRQSRRLSQYSRHPELSTFLPPRRASSLDSGSATTRLTPARRMATAAVRAPRFPAVSQRRQSRKMTSRRPNSGTSQASPSLSRPRRRSTILRRSRYRPQKRKRCPSRACLPSRSRFLDRLQ